MPTVNHQKIYCVVLVKDMLQLQSKLRAVLDQLDQVSAVYRQRGLDDDGIFFTFVIEGIGQRNLFVQTFDNYEHEMDVHIQPDGCALFMPDLYDEFEV